MDIAKWLKREMDRISERGQRTKNIEGLMKRLGKSLNHYYTYERGDVELTSDQVDICAEFFGVEPPLKKPNNNHRNDTAKENVVQLRASSHLRSSPAATVSSFANYPILGTVDAGAFREADSLSQVEGREIEGPLHTVYPNARRMAWEARGDSMNEAGIIDGSILIGVDFNEASGALANGMIVVVERNRDGLIERSVKIVAIYPDRVEFQPRSNNPAHKPIVQRYGDSDSHSPVEIRVLTVVHCVLRML